MGLEPLLPKQRIQQELLEKTSSAANSVEAEEVFPSQLEAAGDLYTKESAGQSKDRKNFVDNLVKKLNDDNTSFKAGDRLTPETLQAYLKDNVKDSALRAEIDGYIKEIENVGNDTVKYLDMHKKDNSLQNAILAVYINAEYSKAVKDVTNYMYKDEVSDNFTKQMEKLDTYSVKAENGKKNPYKQYAVDLYKEQVIPDQMETTLRQDLIQAGEKNLINANEPEEFVLGVAIQMHTANLSKEGEERVDKEYDAYVRKRSGIAGLTKRHEAVEKRRKELTSIKYEDIKKALRTDTLAALEPYLNNHKNEDGTYDLSAISDAVLDGVGYDYMLSRSKDELRREIYNTAAILNGAMNESPNITHIEPGINVSKNRDKIVKDLAKFCGFAVEGRDHTPRLWKAAKQTAEGLAVAGAAHCIAPNVRTIILNNDVHVNLKIALQNVGLENYLGEQGAELTYEKLIEVLQQVKVDIPTCFNLLQSLGTGAAAGLVISVLEDLIFGNDIEFEKTCFNNDAFLPDDPQFEDLGKYRNYLQRCDEANGTNTYESVKSILDMYEKNGNWNYKEFHNFFKMIAGFGSNLNCAEIAGAKMYMKKEAVKPQPVEVELVKAEKHWEIKDDDKTEPVTVNEDDPDQNIIFNKRARSSSWAHLVNNVYNCGPDEAPSLVKKYGQTKAIRILKLAQAVTDGDYSETRMLDLYTKSLKGPAALKGEPGFDYDTYYDVLTKNFPPSVKLPQNLAGINRCDISEDERELVAPKANTDNAPAPAKGPARGKYTKTVTVNGQKQKIDMYFYRDNNSVIHEFDTKEERDAELSKIEKETGKKAKEQTYEEMAGEAPENEE